MIQAMDVTRSLGSILVVRAYRFLGHRIAKILLRTNTSNDLSVLGLRTDRDRLPKFSYHEGGICSKSNIRSIFARVKPQVIFHIASPLAPLQSLDLFMKVNVLGTRNF